MRPVLAIIDMQNWFFRTEERSTGLPELISSINELVDIANSKDIPIFQVLTIHKRDRSTWNIVIKQEEAMFEVIEDEQEQLILTNEEITKILSAY